MLPGFSRISLIWSAGLAALLISMIVSLVLGVFDIPYTTIIKSLWQHLLTAPDSKGSFPAAIETTLYDIRLPRIILVVAVGMALSGSGVSLQAIFRNPLVDPFILGISAGAALGAALSLAFFPWMPVQAVAFISGLLAVSIALFFARMRTETPLILLILTGIVVSSFFSAGLSIVQFLVDPDRLGSILFWLMGSFSMADWDLVVSVVPVILAGLAYLLLVGWRLNVLSLGNEEAESLGVSVRRQRLTVIVTASLLTASAVSACGIVGWVGLIVPHMARFVVGPEHRRLVPFTLLLGGIFMLWVDNLSRCLTSYEIPIGIITSLCGAPFFIFLLKRGGRDSWQS